MQETKIISNDSIFEEIISNEEITIVDFYANWCQPCSTLKPHMETLSTRWIRVAFHNVEENPVTPWKFKIMSIPTILFFKKGELIGKVITSDINKVIEKLKEFK